jgi:hypothetical protein
MSPKTTTGALDERERLQNEQANVIGARDTATARVAELSARITAADQQAGAERAAAARAGHAPPSTTDERLALAVELAQQQATARELAAVAARIPEEIVALHRERWEEFAEHAETATQDALVAFANLEDAYRRAYEAWQQAAATWAEPMADLDRREDGADLPGLRGNAVGVGNGERTIPGCPLPDPADVFIDGPARAPRPLGYLPPRRRKAQSQPGTFRDVAADGVVVIDKSPSASEVYTACDRRGFARYVRQGAPE